MSAKAEISSDPWQLEEYAERCIHLAYRCQNQQVRRVLRLLAFDLSVEAHPTILLRQSRSYDLKLVGTVRLVPAKSALCHFSCVLSWPFSIRVGLRAAPYSSAEYRLA